MGSDGGRGQAAAAAEANRVQKQIYDQTRSDLEGYRSFGERGLGMLGNQLNDLTARFTAEDFQKDPGYDFRMQEGQKALERGAAARGGLLGGRALKEIARFGQDYASNEYDRARSRFQEDRDRSYGKLMDIAGMGQNAAAQQASAGQNYASAYGQNVMGAANARAAARAAEGQALMGLAGQGISAWASSDVRLKTNVRKYNVSAFRDVPTYSFRYIDEKYGSKGRHVGVMAQDLLKIDPDHPAVRVGSHGFYEVDYSQLEVRNGD